MTMQRAVKISLKFATQAKANRLAALLSECCDCAALIDELAEVCNVTEDTKVLE